VHSPPEAKRNEQAKNFRALVQLHLLTERFDLNVDAAVMALAAGSVMRDYDALLARGATDALATEPSDDE
jgi:hypothetical protein